jgi:intracellular sulfur oxidation DsrE/DsrF family protein
MKKSILFGAAVVAAVVTAWFAAQAEPQPAGAQPAKGGKAMLRAVVHVNFGDTERQKHGLKNVTNMLKAEGGKAEVVIVCHGPGIALVVKDKSPDAAEVERLIKEGVKFEACENTLKDKGIPKESLIPGVTTVPSGAAEVVRRQQDGYGYFRP